MNKCRNAWGIFFVVAGLLLIPPAFALEGLVNYQGLLTDENGPVNGSVTSVSFELFLTSTGGQRVWGETHATIDVADGIFNVLLGSGTPFSGSPPINGVDFTAGELWLQISIERVPMSSRQRITGVFHAFSSDTLTIPCPEEGSLLAKSASGWNCVAPPSNGLNSLVDMVVEPQGPNCINAGYLISTGLDLNRNGVLEPAERQNSQYLCNGLEGSGTSGNSRPVANAGPDRVVQTGVPVNIIGSFTDTDGDPGAYFWTFSSVPSGSNLTNADIQNALTQTPSFTPDVAGNYVIELVVSDGKELSLPDTAVFTAVSSSPPPAPTLIPEPDFDGLVTSTVTLEWNPVTDPEGNPVEYRVTINGVDRPWTTGTSQVVSPNNCDSGGVNVWRVTARDATHLLESPPSVPDTFFDIDDSCNG